MEDLVVGAQVKVKGLVGTPQHNDKIGVVKQILDTGRVRVILDDKSDISIKPENLVVVAPPAAPAAPAPSSISEFIRVHPSVVQLPSIDLSNKNIRNLEGVQQLTRLTELNLRENKIVSLEGVTFSRSLRELLLDRNNIVSLERVIFPDRLVTLCLGMNQIVSLAGVVFPASLEVLVLPENRIVSLTGVEFPASLKLLSLDGNKISDLVGFKFPNGLKELFLDRNKIANLANVEFPDELLKLSLNGNDISSLSYVKLPKKLVVFSLLGNQPIKSCVNFKIHEDILEFRIGGNICPTLSDKLIELKARLESRFAGPEGPRLMAKAQALSPESFDLVPRQQERRHAFADDMMARLHASASASRHCSYCNKEETSEMRKGSTRLKKCSGCGTTLYCSQTCQSNDWPNHSKVCTGKKEDAPAAAAAPEAAEDPEAEGHGPGAEGGNKSKTRRRRQSKRNKMQPKTKYKYSRRRRPAKSRKYSKRL